MKRLLAVLAVAGALLAVSGAPVLSEPNGATSKPCAPGQQGNPEPGFRPPSCWPGTGQR
jgi:hypothetical protein